MAVSVKILVGYVREFGGSVRICSQIARGSFLYRKLDTFTM